MAEQLGDIDLGTVYVVRNPRAKKIIARWRNNAVYLTVPLNYSVSKIPVVLEQMKPRLLALKPEGKQAFDETCTLSTFTFDVKIVQGELNNFYVSLKNGVLNIVCSVRTDFNDDEVQSKIRSCIENALRTEAKRVLPPMLQQRAAEYGFTCSEVKINKSRTHWGSCTSRKVINLSYYCLLLPPHLIDYVLLHELCHTHEMNHSDKFWALLDKLTGSKAKNLTNELKNYRTDF